MPETWNRGVSDPENKGEKRIFEKKYTSQPDNTNRKVYLNSSVSGGLDGWDIGNRYS